MSGEELAGRVDDEDFVFDICVGREVWVDVAEEVVRGIEAGVGGAQEDDVPCLGHF